MTTLPVEQAGSVAEPTGLWRIAAGTQPPIAFNTAFGTSMSAFYSQFLTDEAALPVPVNYLCGGL